MSEQHGSKKISALAEQNKMKLLNFMNMGGGGGGETS